jgi:hypothetical protein
VPTADETMKSGAATEEAEGGSWRHGGRRRPKEIELVC